MEQCLGRYRSISVWHLFGSDEYYDMSGNLIAAYRASAAIRSFCNDASSAKTYGKIPTCTTEFAKIDVCKQ